MARDRKVTVIGAGPAGLMAATAARERGAKVTLFEAKPSAGRKLLVAGKGGLNLTHAEPLEQFLSRYREARGRLEPFVRAFPPEELRTFVESLGQPTFVGSSHRIFPRSGKAAPLLRAWVARLKKQGVTLRVRHRWIGLRGGAPLFETPSGTVLAESDATILALGGGSWPETGSDGGWVSILRSLGVEVADLRPANAGVEIAWPAGFPGGAEGQAIKNATFACGSEQGGGDAVVTSYGLEGTPIYRLGPALREAVGLPGGAELVIDLKPSIDAEALSHRLAGPKSFSTRLKALKLSPAARALALATRRVKDLRLKVTAIRPLTEAISSAGGVRWSGVDETLMLRALPGVFVAGEMLDWEAPTGGYLLQACFATGRAAGLAAASW